MTRELAMKTLDKYIKSDALKKHMIYSAFIIEELANELKEDPARWFLAGLLHDIDIEQSDYSENSHGLLAEGILKEEGVTDEEIIEAIKFHNSENNGVGDRSKKFHHALSSSESVSGLISAMALILPDKSVKKVKVKSLVKRMKETAFARNVSRDNILECEKIGVELRSFFEIALRGSIKAEDFCQTASHE